MLPLYIGSAASDDIARVLLALVVLLRPRAVQPQGAIGPQLAEDAVEGHDDGGGQDDAERDQLRRDLLEGSDALGDGVCCCIMLVTWKGALVACWLECEWGCTGMFFFLGWC